MGTKISDLIAAVALASTDILHIRTVGGIDKKATFDLLVAEIKALFNLVMEGDGTFHLTDDLEVDGISTLTGAIAAGSTLSIAGIITALAGIITTSGTPALKTKLVSTGVWNMDSTATIQVAHGLTGANIRGLILFVRDDNVGTSWWPIDASDSVTPTEVSGICWWSVDNVHASRVASKRFDNVGFDSVAFVRGYFLISYV